MLATILIPTSDHGETLRFSLSSIFQQTVQDFEVLIVGDGVPEQTKPLIRELAASDKRCSYFDHPKHERRGEPYRHAVLSKARGDIVCYMTDRDLWLPTHLEQMLTLLKEYDYANALPLHAIPTDTPEGELRLFPVDLQGPGYLDMMLKVSDNRIPFSCFAHTLAAYWKLPEGWATTPPQEWTDLYMWRKFFRTSELTGISGVLPTAVTFPSPVRPGWSTAQRVLELERWTCRLASPEGRQKFEREALIAALVSQRHETLKLSSELGKAWRQLALRNWV
jgi:GalNAc5-diNAcBac-PP-undecaprenol beta-1,3-glucosyltransferase